MHGEPEAAAPLDPRRLLEMALERLGEQDGPRPGTRTASEVAAAFPELEILGLIDRGGAGAVYAARDPRLGRDVALKLLSTELAGDAAFAERFARETRSLAALEHPNILAVHGFGERDGVCYLLSERVDGTDLRRMLRMGRISPAEALRIVGQVALALHFAHGRGVVHRDIKPENILVDQRGHVRIADFGIAKLLDVGQELAPLTVTGQAVGTPHYMAPEQITGFEPVDQRADVYALGVVLYELLTGQLPLGRFALPSEVIGTDRDLDDIVVRALAQSVERRYPSVDELAADLERVARRDSSASSGGARRGRLKVGLVASLVLLLALAVGGTVVAYLALTDEGFRRDPGKTELAVLAAGIAAIVVAWVVTYAFVTARRIERSRGALRGRGLALTVAWTPILVAVDAAILAAPTAFDVRHSTLSLTGWIVVLVVADVLFLIRRQRRRTRTAAPA